MSTTPSTTDAAGTPDRQQLYSAMFASLVMQHTNMAAIFLGQAPNPQTGETAQDLDHARFFIDQLEMLEVKTKGNLDKQEAAMLKQSLTSLRLAFVDAVNKPPKPDDAKPSPPAPPSDEQETPIVEPALPGENAPPTEESGKKFSKKYS